MQTFRHIYLPHSINKNEFKSLSLVGTVKNMSMFRTGHLPRVYANSCFKFTYVLLLVFAVLCREGLVFYFLSSVSGHPHVIEFFVVVIHFPFVALPSCMRGRSCDL